MTWLENIDQRLILDSGSFNFRFGKPEGETMRSFHCLSKLQIEKKTGAVRTISPSDQLIDEMEYNLGKCHTKGIITNYLNFNDLIEVGYTNVGLTNDKKILKNYALIYQARPFQPTRSRCNDLEFFFELEGFNAVLPINTGEHVFGKESSYSGVLIDMGHSHTYVIPVFNNCIIKNSVRRLEIGGNLLNKCLMDAFSFSQIDLKNHYFIANQIKERKFVVESKNTLLKKLKDKEKHKNGVFVLPDFEMGQAGTFTDTATPDELNKPHIKLSNQMSIIPESIFCPNM